MSPAKKPTRSQSKRPARGKPAKGRGAPKKANKPKGKKGAGRAPSGKKQKLLRGPTVVAAPEENPRALKTAQHIAQLVLDKKAENVVILDVRGKTSYADYLVLASGESERQVSAMAEHVEVTMKADGQTAVGSEGYETGHWVLIDFGEVVVHLFYREVRDFYDLDGLWADAAREKVA